MSSVCKERFPDNACAEDIIVNSQSFNAVNTVTAAPATFQAKVPVLVATAIVNQPIRDSICIPERFYSIKAVSRRPILTQCYVVVNTPVTTPITGTLYVEGYILKNVQYATPIVTTPTPTPPCCEEAEECLAFRNDYNDLTAKIKFDFAVPVTLSRVILATPATVDQRAIFKDCHKQCDSGTISESDCEKIYSQNVQLQEPFTCELNSYSINEAFISKVTCDEDDTNLFDTIVEKLNLNLNISIFQLQNRAITIPG
ncbi:hypothetical protein ACFO6R_03075 [Eubacterium multiforme]|uniref:DUF7852 domain-containing protein n=1 Tax=Eubacterium multiforme TaxID=83339 RepID=A0ABT9UQ65_9FIRM|nr:hypothetical protein [Eubacterium multiforme]MDQ0148261.1 hypothetical protein [Eubacterium multiforme]